MRRAAERFDLVDREQKAQPDRIELAVGQFLGLAEDVLGNGDLAEVVQQRGVAHLAQRIFVEVQLGERAGADGVGSDP